MNFISKVLIDNEVVGEKVRLKNHVVEFFMNLYIVTSLVRSKLDGVVMRDVMQNN